MNGLSVSCPNPPASNSRSMHKPARTRSPKIVKSGVTGTKILRRGPEEKYAAYAFKGASRCLRGRVSVSSPLCGTRKCPSYICATPASHLTSQPPFFYKPGITVFRENRRNKIVEAVPSSHASGLTIQAPAQTDCDKSAALKLVYWLSASLFLASSAPAPSRARGEGNDWGFSPPGLF